MLCPPHREFLSLRLLPYYYHFRFVRLSMTPPDRIGIRRQLLLLAGLAHAEWLILSYLILLAAQVLKVV